MHCRFHTCPPHLQQVTSLQLVIAQINTYMLVIHTQCIPTNPTQSHNHYHIIAPHWLPLPPLPPSPLLRVRFALHTCMDAFAPLHLIGCTLSAAVHRWIGTSHTVPLSTAERLFVWKSTLSAGHQLRSARVTMKNRQSCCCYCCPQPGCNDSHTRARPISDELWTRPAFVYFEEHNE